MGTSIYKGGNSVNTNSINCKCKYKETFNNLENPMLIIDAKSGLIDDANIAACNYYSYSKKELLSMNISDINILTKEEIFKEINKVKNKSSSFLRFKHKLSNGEIRDVEVYSSSYKIGEKDLLSSIIHDVKRTNEWEKDYIKNKLYFESLYNNSPEAIAIVDNEFRILNINSNFKNLFQYDLQDIENLDITEVLCEPTLYGTSYNFRESISAGRFVSEEVFRYKKDGSKVQVLLLGFPLLIDEEVVGAYYIYSDLFKSKQQEYKIKSLTYNDGLTGLYNRKFFLENLKNEISKKTSNNNIGDKLSLIILKVNEFKEINDALGHLVGEWVLKKFARRLRVSGKAGYIISRFSEDEFAILIPNRENSEEVDILIKSIIDNLKALFLMNTNELQITTNIGIATYPDDGMEYINLIRKAEIALDKSKNKSINSSIQFENSFDKEIQEYFWIKNDLLKAMQYEELFLNYQPIYNTSTHKLIGAEALIRWNHKKKGIIPPLKFIPIAEQTGMIQPIGEWVLIQACNQNKRWQDLGFEPILISVNISVLQLEQPGFSSMVKRVLKESKLDPKYLQLEITETYFTRDYELIKEEVIEISNHGVKFAIDDFGTGYSSLGQLCELSINNIKIDRMFIDGVHKNNNKSKIVKTIISLTESLGIGLTAEGVETEEELEFLKENKCDMVQGYLFSKPVESNEIEKLLEKLNG